MTLKQFLLQCEDCPKGFFPSDAAWQSQFEKFKNALRKYWKEHHGKEVEW